MITAKRDNNVEGAYSSASSVVDVLERKTPDIQQSYENTPKEERSIQTKERMQQNLEKLLNYDRYSETQVEKEVKIEEPVLNRETSQEEEDIRPTSTTMQFGEDSIDQVYGDLSKQNEENSYKLNGKGKIVLLLYSLAIAVILSLIILNTGVLAALTKDKDASARLLLARQAEYNVINSEIENVSSNDYILNIAQNEYGMIIR